MSRLHFVHCMGPSTLAYHTMRTLLRPTLANSDFRSPHRFGFPRRMGVARHSRWSGRGVWDQSQCQFTCLTGTSNSHRVEAVSTIYPVVGQYIFHHSLGYLKPRRDLIDAVVIESVFEITLDRVPWTQ